MLIGGGGSATAFADPGSTNSDDATAGRAADASGANRPTDPAHRPHSQRPGSRRGDAPPKAVGGTEDEAPGTAIDDAGEPKPPSEADAPEPGNPRRPDVVPVPGEQQALQDIAWLPPCCESGKDGCIPGWPWPLWPTDPDASPDDDSDYGENRPPETGPPIRPMPPVGGPETPGVLDTVPGIGTGDATQAPINVPIIITGPIGVGPVAAPAVGAGPGPSGAGMPAAPRPGTAPPAAPPRVPSSPREPLPSTSGTNVAAPASASRVGYAEHLRSAGIPQLAALALPGLAGILILTGAGGLVGYRQAKAGQGVRPSGIARFMN